MNNPEITFAFSFNKAPFDALKPHVAGFKGSGALNRLFSFNVTLLLENQELENLDVEALMGSPASLEIIDNRRQEAAGEGQSDGQPLSYRVKWSGVVASMEIGDETRESSFVEVQLTSALAPLKTLVQNRIHLNCNSIAVVEESLLLGGIGAQSFDFGAIERDQRPIRDFVFQYDEDLLTFTQRILEREGLALYHDQRGDGEILKLAEKPADFLEIVDENGTPLTLTRARVSGLTVSGSANPVYRFRAKTKIPPAKLLLKDYNWQQPALPLSISVEVSPKGHGEVYLFGENFEDETEGLRLANIRKEEFLAGASVYSGETRLPGLLPGHVFALSDETTSMFNGRYLVVAFEAEGRQAGAPINFPEASPGGEGTFFRHEFVCQKAETPFRPARITPIKKIAGSITAWIDGAGSGDKPEMDLHGRYKVLLPLDVSGRGGGKASAWIRQAQPSVGGGYGQSFPLHPGVEVLLTFIDGNPDRPLISAAVPNGETGATINAALPEAAGFATKSGGGLLFLNTPNSQTLSLSPGIRNAGIFFTAGMTEAEEAEQEERDEDQDSKIAKLEESDAKEKGKVAALKNTSSSAVFNADTIENNASFNKMVSVCDGTAVAGNKFEIKAGSEDLLKVSQFAKVIQETAAKASSAAKSFMKANDFYKDEMCETKNMADYVFRGLDTALTIGNDDVLKSIKIYEKIKKNREDSKKPASLTYDPMLALTVSDKGESFGRWQSNDSEKSSTVLANLLLAANSGAFVSTYYAANDDIDAGTDVIIDKDDKGVDGMKVASKYAKGLGDLLGLVSTILAFLATEKALSPKKRSGILVENEDSFVNVKSNEHLCLSAMGPILLESLTGGRQINLLSSPEYFDKLMDDLLTPEIFLKSYMDKFKLYKNFKAIVLRTVLQRTLATEINQQAHGALLSKAGRLIQLTTGLSKDGNFKEDIRKDRRKKRWAAAKKVKDFKSDENRKLPDDNPAKINPKTVFDAEVEAQDPGLLKYSKDFIHGILLEARQEKQHIQVRTCHKTGTISLWQDTEEAKFSAFKRDESRALTLCEEGVFLYDAKQRGLKVDKDGIQMSFDKDVALKMAAKRFELNCGQKNQISLADGDLTLKHSKKIALNSEVGLEASAKKIDLIAKANFKIDGQMINIG
ncbi:MAG: type VI secretion system tip protein VgrG [Deltaproteobacteria bacterium]|jgi:type VI secretion system secreted protein VgrG|nr:type VI secretion system tip protein VgrG [Deltaproteobacteria bacterium]